MDVDIVDPVDVGISQNTSVSSFFCALNCLLCSKCNFLMFQANTAFIYFTVKTPKTCLHYAIHHGEYVLV